jgi:hypothetical protein
MRNVAEPLYRHQIMKIISKYEKHTKVSYILDKCPILWYIVLEGDPVLRKTSASDG